MNMNAPYPNPAPSPRINVTQNPFCADYYMDWMLCHVTTMLRIQPEDHTGINNRNFIYKGKVIGIFKCTYLTMMKLFLGFRFEAN